jgi:hypothetical protein
MKLLKKKSMLIMQSILLTLTYNKYLQDIWEMSCSLDEKEKSF